MKILPEESWQSLDSEEWQALEGEFWGGAGIRYDTAIDFTVTGTVEMTTPVIFDSKLEFIVENVAGEHNYYDLLMHLLPYYETSNLIFRTALRGCATIFSYIESLLIEMENEESIDTAVSTLEEWEKLLLLDGAGKTMQERREAVRSARWSLRGTVQEEDIKRVARAYTNGEIEIVRTSKHGHYVIRFVSVMGKPRGLDAFDKVLKRMLNAGYTWEYEFRYVTWDDLGEKEWQELSSKTWDMIKEAI